MDTPLDNHSNQQPPRNPARNVDHELFLECVHCGLCTSTCPTFTELGDENDGPRGRIQLMRMVAENRSPLSDRIRRHLDLCLDCRACETACPSGVEYGRLIEPFRVAMQEDEQREKVEKQFDWFREIILYRLFPYAERMRIMLTPVRIAQQLGLWSAAERIGLMKLIPGRMGRMVRLLPPPVRQGPRLPRFLPAIGRKRAQVGYFVGCVADVMFRHTHWATLRVLQQNGCDVFIPEGQGCCGAIHFHAGSSRKAREMADANLVAFELDRCDAIVVNHAGCGAMMKEYGVHWHDGLQPHREKFSAKVMDVHEFLNDLGLLCPSGHIKEVATYHDACHLAHAQEVTDAPRNLLAKIPGLQLIDLPETEICCGSAGTYNLNEAAMADRLAQRKVDNIVSTGARLVLAANAGCLLQIASEVRQRKLPLRVMHPMDLLDLSYRGEQPT
ncbi:MAG: (Fe-S)-binding protein [Patescibacteria group bacterium]|nr:(Fe-S)-binding protein [Patescibacteria group bacterium]